MITIVVAMKPFDIFLLFLKNDNLLPVLPFVPSPALREMQTQFCCFVICRGRGVGLYFNVAQSQCLRFDSFFVFFFFSPFLKSLKYIHPVIRTSEV